MKINNVLIFTVLAALFFSAASCGKSNEGGGKAPERGDVAGNTMVIYEANPKVFAKTSCLNAISERLEDIQDLGVNVLWLMPIHPEGVEKGIGSPYCVKDYKAVNPTFGSLADLKSLVTKAHSMGMKVIMDWIANHTSWDNAWITQHPQWYTQVSGVIVSPPGQNWTDVADLNFDNAELRSAMIDAMTYWIKEADIDGFRCDYAEGVPLDFWEDAIDQIRKLKPEAIMLAEGSKTNLYDAGFDMLYGWNFLYQLPEVFAGSKSVSHLYDVHRQEMNELKEGQTRMRHIINHDRANERAVTAFYKSEAGSLAAMVIATFMGGVPMIYSSQEIAYSKSLSFFSYNPMDWDSNPDYTSRLQDIMEAYHQTAQYRSGDMRMYQTDNVFFIYYNSGLSVIVNTKDSAQTIKTPMERVGDSVVDVITGESQRLQTMMTLEPYQYLILKR